jgi:hypothetical protein
MNRGANQFVGDQKENKMKALMAVFSILIISAFALPTASAVPIDLYECYVNIDGTISAVALSGVGTITINFSPGIAGNYFIGAYFDYEIDENANTFFNEFGAVTLESPPAELSWEIDEPGFVYGDIYDNFVLGSLDNSNGVPDTAPDDVAMALGWNFSLTDSQYVTVSFTATSIQPLGFHLAQFDPDSAYAIYLFSDYGIGEGGSPVIPEPATWVLLLTGLSMAGVATRQFRKN